MIDKLVARSLSLFVLLIASPAPGQTPPKARTRSPDPALRKLAGDDARRVNELNKSIESAVKADRWDQAIAKAEEALALRTRVQGPKHFETTDAEWVLKTLQRVAQMPRENRIDYHSAISMDEQVALVIARGKYAQAQPLFSKALEIRRRLLTEDHPVTADSYNNLAYCLGEQGKYAEARPLLDKALEIRRRLLTDLHPATASTYSDLAMNLDAQGRHAQAQELLEKALEIKRLLLTDDDVDTASSYNNLAGNLASQGKFARAQPLFEKALEINRRLLTDNHPLTANSYESLAYNLNAQGAFAQAQPLFEKALEIKRRALTDDHPETAITYNNVASNLNAQGKYAQAQPLFEKALASFRRLLTEDHPNTASSYHNLADNLNSQGKYEDARSMFNKALEIRRRVLTDLHPDTALSYSSMAANLRFQRKYDEAQPLYEKALEIRRRLLTDDHPRTANGYSNVALNLQSQGKYSQAQPLFEKALEIYRRVLTDLHPGAATINSNLANNLYAQGKYADARDRWLLAVKTLDEARLRIAFTGLERAATRESMRLSLAAVLARLGQPAEAWQALEQDLGRGLLDELAARQDRRLTSGERARLRALTAELERLDKLVETTPKSLDQAERAKRFEGLKRERDLASIALGEFQTTLVHDHGALAGRVAGLDEIQAALNADAALIDWVDIPPVGANPGDPDGDHWAVIVRARGAPVWVPIAGTGPNGLWTKDDTGLAQRVRMMLGKRPGSGSSELRPLLEKLRAQRIEPLVKVLAARAANVPPARRLIVLPSRAMSGIPVEALLAPDDTRTVSYAPSATVYKYVREQARPDRRAGLLALGDPVYERPEKSSDPKSPPTHGVLANDTVPPSPGSATQPANSMLTAARSGELDFTPLPGTRYEVEALAQLFKSDDRPARILLGADASEPGLDQLAASGELARFGFIHLATHGVIDEDVPARSAVILTQTDLPDPLLQALSHQPVFDGRLSVREIQRGWELKAELVTLSACETALGRESGGEGFVGFTQALLMSGTRSVCLSLWRVDDTASALLMQRFYANLLGRRPGLTAPMPKSEALREAKVWLGGMRRAEVLAITATMAGGIERSKGAKARQPTDLAAAIPAGKDDDQPYASPHFWAAFVLAGDPD